MKSIGIRFKFILFTSLLLTFIGAAISWYFYMYTKKQLEEELKQRGYSFINQLAQDGEVKDSISVAQRAFFDEPIERLRNLDRERVLAYWRVLLASNDILLEENESWIKTHINNIPAPQSIEYIKEDVRLSSVEASVEAPVFSLLTTNSGEQFYNFVAPVYEKHTIAEEEFAAEIFDLDRGYDESEKELLGVVQIGLTPKRINKKMQMVLWTSSIPLGIIIVMVGIGISYFIAKSIVKPVERLVRITDRVASGDLEQSVEISSRDEIGMLASRFNQMTKSLKRLIGEKEIVVDELKVVNKELSSINTELVQKNEQLEDTQEQLIRTEKLAAVGKLASGVSHELRNPLGSIKNAVFFLKKKLTKKEPPEIDTRVIQFLDIMDKEIDRSNKIINDLLGFARIAKPTRVPSDIAKVIDESLTRVKIAENINLVRNFQSNLPIVMMDTNQMGQVFINLFENACQAMPDGGELRISAKESKDSLKIELADSGCGIPEKKIKKIFDPLFTTKTKGTGMGLSVCHEIIQKHEGTIVVESLEGKGTNFLIKLPLEEKNAGAG